MTRVSAADVGSTITFWNLRSSAPSFSIFFLYSSSVVAPMHWISPRASAGLSKLAASIDPDVFPAPTIVCISSIKSMTLSFLASSSRIALMRSSNCPRYLVPATTEAISSDIRRLSKSTRDTRRSTIRRASPSTIALFPTPGSPIRTGLFFLRRLSICARRSISFSRPTTGSRRPSSAARVMSLPYRSSAGVSPLRLVLDLPLPEAARRGDPSSLLDEGGNSSSSSSIISSSSIASSALDWPFISLSASDSRLYVTSAALNGTMKSIDTTSELWNTAISRCSTSITSLPARRDSNALSFTIRLAISLTDISLTDSAFLSKSIPSSVSSN